MLLGRTFLLTSRHCPLGTLKCSEDVLKVADEELHSWQRCPESDTATTRCTDYAPSTISARTNLTRTNVVLPVEGRGRRSVLALSTCSIVLVERTGRPW